MNSASPISHNLPLQLYLLNWLTQRILMSTTETTTTIYSKKHFFCFPKPERGDNFSALLRRKLLAKFILFLVFWLFYILRPISLPPTRVHFQLLLFLCVCDNISFYCLTLNLVGNNIVNDYNIVYVACHRGLLNSME